jgi:thiol-disulfide isomerase/thioredoxin
MQEDQGPGQGGSSSGGATPGARERGGFERILLLVVLLIIGGALGYAAFLSTAARPSEDSLSGDVVVVSKGEKVDLAANAVKGKYTLYDFYADWCPPCRALDPQLRQLASRHDNVAIRKIDIIDWTTPVVAQHGVEALPFMVLFGPDGKQLASGDDVYPMVARLFDTELY